MRYDTIIIGGGMSGLMAGIALVKQGQHVAILAKGISSLHYNSGSLDLMGRDLDGNEVLKPLEAIAALPDEHPYRRVADVAARAVQAREILEEAGIKVRGTMRRNHYRLTPTGLLKPTWLTLDDYLRIDNPEAMPWQRATVFNIRGFLDFPDHFVAAGMRRLGVECDCKDITTPQIERRRATPGEMRSTALARTLNSDAALVSLAAKINSQTDDDTQAVLFPALLGLDDDKAARRLRRLIDSPLYLVPTLPASVGGTRIHTMLRKYFVNLGGTYMLGSTVTGGTMDANGRRVVGIKARNLPDQVIRAKHYLLASGSFMSGGLISTHERVVEPIFGLDVNAPVGRDAWTREYLYDRQPYMEFGVVTDGELHPLRDGKPIANLWAAGSILAGNSPIALANAAGLSMLTALEASSRIASK
ncbi:MAG: glycerol-3-phosphate dehydrogenase subunit GlpB [Muribaculaceae bacterium]|nr:glycerol-3-phosphate dehydrogenase subunit GlpB [Muribaculaceae bacterium]